MSLESIISTSCAVLGLLVAYLGLRERDRKTFKRTAIIVAVLILMGAAAIAISGSIRWIPRSSSYSILWYKRSVRVDTFAGSGQFGDRNGAARQAEFKTPEGLDVDAEGNVYVAEFDGHRIRLIYKKPKSAEYQTRVFAGNGVPGYGNGVADKAQFASPSDVAVCPKRNAVIVADWSNHCIRAIDLNSQMVTTIAGGARLPGRIDGPASQARFCLPSGVACDNNGNIYVADFGNGCVRKLDMSGNVSTIAGRGVSGMDVGKATSQAALSGPMDLAIGDNGEVYVADSYNNAIRKLVPNSNDPERLIEPFAGDTEFGFVDGKSAQAGRLCGPGDVLFDGVSKLVLIADTDNDAIRIVSPAGALSTLAGDVPLGFADGSAMAARFRSPYGLAALPNGDFLIADSGNNRIRVISGVGEGASAGSGRSGK